MISEIKYNKYICDLCKHEEQSKDSYNSTGYVKIKLPYKPLYQNKLISMELDVCQDCANKIFQYLSKEYEMYTNLGTFIIKEKNK